MVDEDHRSRGNRWRAASFRRAVLFFLTGSGLRVTERDTSRPIPLSQAVLEEASDIRGLRHFALVTRVDLKLNLSDALDRAVAAADYDDKPYGAVVQWRRGRDAGENYVVMTLSHFSAVVALLEGMQP